MVPRLLVVVALVVGCGGERTREVKHYEVAAGAPLVRPAAPSAEKRARLPRATMLHGR